MERYAVIMAGGKGERFWPCSRENRPKQMLALFSEQTLIEQTVLRVHELVPYERMFVVTNKAYVEPLRTLLPQLPAVNIIGEPARRDTAPCIALAAGIAKSSSPDGVMMVFPSDAAISHVAQFVQDVNQACEQTTHSLVTIGIPPTWPSSDYGYIEAESAEKISGVRRFVEKPSPAKAEEFLKLGTFCWNAGIFAWRLDVLQRELKTHCPQLAEYVEQVAIHWGQPDWTQFLEESFVSLDKISIDYALLEKSQCIRMIRAGFDWDDVGNWSALRNHLPADEDGNVKSGNVQLLDCHRNIVYCQDAAHLVAGIDLEGLVVVQTENATLVAPEISLVKIKKLLAAIGAGPENKEYL